MITRELLLARIRELQLLKDRYLADANAVSGAIQDCEFWLNLLQDPPAEIVVDKKE